MRKYQIISADFNNNFDEQKYDYNFHIMTIYRITVEINLH